MQRFAGWFLTALLPAALVAEDAPPIPRSLDPRLKIELFAEHPQIVTPTGIDVDHLGRVWAVENNTHFQPENYQGHKTDRVLVMRDASGDGRADQTVVFLDGLRDTMSVALRPRWFPPEEKSKGRKVEESKSRRQELQADSSTLSVYIATRRDITLYHDDNGDLKPDRQERIVTLETAGNYPHNALAGFAFDALGWMYFGFGENLGENYKVIGSDATTLSGGGEGGNVYRCRLDGTKLEQWATGFWNPHASCVDAFGRLFTVDNDPDSRPPCRLLHVIKGGDYGFRFRNGRKGLHPFTSWNGEIPGTLPMVSGTGEAPSGILAYESDGLPEDYIGNLLVTSWGDHRIDRFRLKPRGASFESLPEPMILGGQDFRPVGIACAPDGSLYCTDWMLYDYRVHRKGRVWRVSAVKPAPDSTGLKRLLPDRSARLNEMLTSKRLSDRRTAAHHLSRSADGRARLIDAVRGGESVVDDTKINSSTRTRLEAVWALATVPVQVEQFGFLTNYRSPCFGCSQWDEVLCAAFNLAGTPQFQISTARFPMYSERTSWFSWYFGMMPKADDRSFMLAKVHLFKTAQPSDPDNALRAISDLDDSDPAVFSTHVDWLRSLEVSEKRFAELLERHKFPVFHFITCRAIDERAASARQRIGVVLAARQVHPRSAHLSELALSDNDKTVRRAAVQWVAEERLVGLRPQVEAILNDPSISADLFLATLAALEMLDGVKPVDFDKTPAGKYVLPMVQDEKRPAAVRALALRLVDPAEPALDAGLLGNLLRSDDKALQLEAVRTLQQSPVEQAFSLLRSVAADESRDANLRAEAVVGLARPGADGRLAPEARELLLKLLGGGNDVLRREALRALGGFIVNDAGVNRAIEELAHGAIPAVSQITEEARRIIDGSGGLRPPLAGVRAALAEATRAADDPQAGRRAFYHPQGAGCFKCHTINGRGGKVGPDLSTIGRAMSREKLIDSILEPSREIAPQFVTWALETSDGKVHTGMIVRENADSGTTTRTTIGDSEGKTTELRTADIVSRTPQKTSIMPEKLHERMSPHEFRDLLAYLESLK